MQNLVKFCILFVTGFCSCVPTLWGNFVFDDGEAVVKNGVVIQPHTVPWTRALFVDFWGVNICHPHSHKSYRPFTLLTYRWDFQLWGLNPFPFHLENLLIHGLNCGLVYFFLLKCLRIGRDSCGGQSLEEEGMKKLAFVASVLFAVHPIHVEPLGGIVGRADLLGGLAFISGFLLIPDNNGGWNSCLLVIIFSIIGSLFKETAITLTILHISLQFALKDRFRLSRGKFVQYSLSLLAIGVFVIWRLWFQGGPPVFQAFDNPPAFATSYFTKVSSILYIWGVNTFILLNPIWLCYDWSGDCVRLIDSLSDFRLIPIALFLCVSVGLLFKSLQNRVILLASVLFGTTFLPSSNLIFTVGFVLAERNLYLPSIGFSLLIAYAILEKGNTQILLYLIVILMARSIHRSFQWEDQSTLFKSGASVCPNNAKIHYNLGSMHTDAGNAEDAEKSYKYAIALRSDYYQAMNNLGNLLRSTDINESEYWLRKAVLLKPDFAAAWMNLGIVVTKKNQSDALICYKNALQFRKIYPDCEYNLGNLYLDMGNKTAALECWTRATSMKPSHTQSWINRVILLEQEEKLEDAKNIALEGLQAVPNCDTLHFLLGNILGKLSDFESAELHFINAIEISTQFGRNIPAKYFSNLGVLYHRWGRKHQAIESYNNALKIDSSSESVKKYLNSLLNNK